MKSQQHFPFHAYPAEEDFGRVLVLSLLRLDKSSLCHFVLSVLAPPVTVQCRGGCEMKVVGEEIKFKGPPTVTKLLLRNP